MPGDGATRAGPEKLAALFWDSGSDAACGQTDTDSGKELLRCKNEQQFGKL